MGNNCSQIQRDKEWITISSSQTVSLLKNIRLSFEVQKHTKYLTNMQWAQQAGIYHWRKNNKGKNNILEVYEIKLDNSVTLNHLSDKYMEEYRLDAYMQHIEHIDKIQSPSNQFMINLVENWIDGMIELVKKFGYFKIKQNMVGFNKYNIGKIWINSSFIEINRQYPYEDSTRGQIKMINDLIKIFENKFQSIKQLKNKNFGESKKYIKQLQLSSEQIKNSINVQIKTLNDLVVEKPYIKQRTSQRFFHKQNTIPNKSQNSTNIGNTRSLKPLNQLLMTTTNRKFKSKQSLMNCTSNQFMKTFTCWDTQHQHKTLPQKRISLKNTLKSQNILCNLNQTRKQVEKNFYTIKSPGQTMVQSIILIKQQQPINENSSNVKIQQSVIIRGMNQSQR